MNVQMRVITSATIDMKHTLGSVKYSDIVENLKNNNNNNNDKNNEPVVEVSTSELLNQNEEDKKESRIKAPDTLSLWNEVTLQGITLYESTILNPYGDSTETYTLNQLNGKKPDFYPKMWDFNIIQTHQLYPDKVALSLDNNKIPNNWDKVIQEYINLKQQGRTTDIVLELEESRIQNEVSAVSEEEELEKQIQDIKSSLSEEEINKLFDTPVQEEPKLTEEEINKLFDTPSVQEESEEKLSEEKLSEEKIDELFDTPKEEESPQKGGGEIIVVKKV